MRFFKLIPIILIMIFIAACGKSEIETNMSEEVADFTFTTQDNKSLGLKDLEGKWWIADFIFTNCETVCLPMTANMAELQRKAKEENLKIQFVSFSLDPERDTPEVLTEFANYYKADTSSWAFLTGYDFETIKKLSIKSFRSMAEMPRDEEDDQIIHGTSFFLVNPEGQVVKSYSGMKAEVMEDIIDDLKVIQ